MMKRVLITGANSFLGDSVKRYLENSGGYEVDTLDMLKSDWVKTSFSKYNVVINVCAIVHRPKEKNETLYFSVNKDLAVRIAEKAKKEGVGQFVQISTNGVFGVELGEMNAKTVFKPKTSYEKSKYAADCELEKMREQSFNVCIVRPPLIYGKGCKGNFPKLESFALKFSFFPSWKNERDMIYITNICDFIRFAIENGLNEICYPRDKERICVSDMIKQIASLNGKEVHLLGILNPFVAICYRFSHKTRSVFGNNYCTIPVCGGGKLWASPFSMTEALKDMYVSNRK